MDFEQLDFIILFGLTGCGKSEILGHLKTMGEQVIELEKLANHRGSSFGSLEGKPQPSQQKFEEKIFAELSNFNPSQAVWVEFESNYLGKLKIPEALFDKWKKSKILVVEMERDIRIERIVDEYKNIAVKDLLLSAQKIKRKVSAKKYRFIRKKIKEGDYHRAASAIITYYDRIYENLIGEKSNLIFRKMSLSSSNSLENAKKILGL